MNTFINNISKEKDINPNITDKIEDISDFHHYIFHKLSFNSPLITQNNNDLIKYYNFIEKVINFFINCVNLFMNLNNSCIKVNNLTGKIYCKKSGESRF